MKVHTKFSGELRFRVFSADQLDSAGELLADATPKVDTGFNPQLITDAFFESYIGTGTDSRESFFAYMGVGTGTATPAVSDTTITQLGTRFARYGSGSGSVVSNTIEQSSEYRTTQGQIVGTISEVALFTGSTGGQTNMRSLIKDGGGAPTTLTLTSTDFLYVTWRVTSTVNLSDQTGTIVLGGVTYDYVMRPTYWTSGSLEPSGSTNVFACATYVQAGNSFGLDYVLAGSTQTLASVTSAPSAGTSWSTSMALSAYTAASKQRKVTYTSSIGDGNVSGGIGCLVFRGSSQASGYQISFSAQGTGNKIPKDNTKTMTIGITFSFGR